LLDKDARSCRVAENYIDNFSAAGIEDRSGDSSIHRNNWAWLYPSDISDDLYGVHFPNGLSKSIVKGNRSWLKEGTGTGTQPIAVSGEVTDSRVGNNFYYDLFEKDAVSTEWRSQYTMSGDGSTTTFQLNHNIVQMTDDIQISAASEDAAGEYWIGEVTPDTVEIHYRDPPPKGSENLKWNVTMGTK
jgi:hypothetical protein